MKKEAEIGLAWPEAIETGRVKGVLSSKVFREKVWPCRHFDFRKNMTLRNIHISHLKNVEGYEREDFLQRR